MKRIKHSEAEIISILKKQEQGIKLTATPNTVLTFGGVSLAVALSCSALFFH